MTPGRPSLVLTAYGKPGAGSVVQSPPEFSFAPRLQSPAAHNAVKKVPVLIPTPVAAVSSSASTMPVAQPTRQPSLSLPLNFDLCWDDSSSSQASSSFLTCAASASLGNALRQHSQSTATLSGSQSVCLARLHELCQPQPNSVESQVQQHVSQWRSTQGTGSLDMSQLAQHLHGLGWQAVALQGSHSTEQAHASLPGRKGRPTACLQSLPHTFVAVTGATSAPRAPAPAQPPPRGREASGQWQLQAPQLPGSHVAEWLHGAHARQDAGSGPATELRGAAGTSADGCTLPGPVVVEPRFQEQFVIAHPTQRYQELLQVLPEVFVGSFASLQAVVGAVAYEAAVAFKQQQRPLPPWRTAAALLSKWAPDQLQVLARNMLQPEPQQPCSGGEGLVAHTTTPGYHAAAGAQAMARPWRETSLPDRPPTPARVVGQAPPVHAGWPQTRMAPRTSPFDSRAAQCQPAAASTDAEYPVQVLQHSQEPPASPHSLQQPLAGDAGAAALWVSLQEGTLLDMPVKLGLPDVPVDEPASQAPAYPGQPQAQGQPLPPQPSRDSSIHNGAMLRHRQPAPTSWPLPSAPAPLLICRQSSRELRQAVRQQRSHTHSALAAAISRHLRVGSTAHAAKSGAGQAVGATPTLAAFAPGCTSHGPMVLGAAGAAARDTHARDAPHVARVGHKGHAVGLASEAAQPTAKADMQRPGDAQAPSRHDVREGGDQQYTARLPHITTVRWGAGLPAVQH